MSDRIGEQFGSYRLLRLLGSGGFAEVYLARHIHLNSQAAVKLLHTKLIVSDQESFLREARTIASLEHPSIIHLIDCGFSNETPFIIMDYAPYGTLRQRHPRGTILAPDTILSYVKQVSGALYYAHERRLIHRDIKPENMLIGRRQDLLLSDFGAALMTTTAVQSTKDPIGTATYMAPEQIMGKPGPASDQYALAVVVYEWLCGSVPFQGSFHEIYGQHMYAYPPSLLAKNPGLAPATEEVIFKALDKNPAQRYPGILDFALAVEQSFPNVEKTLSILDRTALTTRATRGTLHIGANEQTYVKPAHSPVSASDLQGTRPALSNTPGQSASGRPLYASAPVSFTSPPPSQPYHSSSSTSGGNNHSHGFVSNSANGRYVSGAVYENNAAYRPEISERQRGSQEALYVNQYGASSTSNSAAKRMANSATVWQNIPGNAQPQMSNPGLQSGMIAQGGTLPPQAPPVSPASPVQKKNYAAILITLGCIIAVALIIAVPFLYNNILLPQTSHGSGPDQKPIHPTVTVKPTPSATATPTPTPVPTPTPTPVIVSAPCLSINQPNLAYTLEYDTQAVNSQNETLSNGRGCGIATWTATTSQSWLLVSDTSGQIEAGSNINVAIQVSAKGLVIGSYTGYVSFQTGSSIKKVIVTLTITRFHSPCLTLSPGVINLKGAYSGDSPDEQETVTLSNNANCSAANWSASQAQSGRVQLSQSSGQLDPGANITITLTITTRTIPVGKYTDVIDFTAVDNTTSLYILYNSTS